MEVIDDSFGFLEASHPFNGQKTYIPGACSDKINLTFFTQHLLPITYYLFLSTAYFAVNQRDVPAVYFIKDFFGAHGKKIFGQTHTERFCMIRVAFDTAFYNPVSGNAS